MLNWVSLVASNRIEKREMVVKITIDIRISVQNLMVIFTVTFRELALEIAYNNFYRRNFVISSF